MQHDRGGTGHFEVFVLKKLIEKSRECHNNKLQLSTNSLGPDVFLNTKIQKKFGSHNGSLTLSMHDSEDTKIKLITIMKQRKVLLTKPKPTASQS